MSKQIFSLKNDWKQLKKEFSNHFKKENVEKNEKRIRYEKSGEHLQISKNGSVSGKMPLHSNKIENVSEVELSESEIKVISEDSSYIFRR